MQTKYQTERLILHELGVNDRDFIFELVNTPEWLKFIGDRSIGTPEDAGAYIQRISDNPNVNYWVVTLQDKQTSIGIVTFIKREYLEQYDIGFAFLSKFTHKGYAYEATVAVLDDVLNHPTHTTILATTMRENTNAIKLLERLGFRFEKEIVHGNDPVLIYAVSADKLFLNKLTNSFYGLFTNTRSRVPVLENIYDFCLPHTVFIKKEVESEESFHIETFIEPRKKILSDGTLTDFEEYQISEETTVVANLAQRSSKYRKKGYLNGKYFETNGTKLLQYIKTNNGWKIACVL